MKKKNRRVQETRLLLVEGVEDTLIVRALFSARGVTDVQVEETGGKPGLRDDLLAWTRTEGFETVRWLGVLQDGDDDSAATFEGMCGVLQSVGMPVPRKPWSSADGSPRVLAGVIEQATHGNDLEGVVLEALHTQQKKRLACVDDLFDCVSGAGDGLPRQLSKARTRAFLATCEPPDLLLGHAAAGLLPLDDPAFDQLANILKL